MDCRCSSGSASSAGISLNILIKIITARVRQLSLQSSPRLSYDFSAGKSRCATFGPFVVIAAFNLAIELGLQNSAECCSTLCNMRP